MKYQCEKHMWNYPEELRGLFGDDEDNKCPVCIFEDAMKDAFEDAKTSGRWGNAENAHQKYLHAMEKHRDNLSATEQQEFDKRTVSDYTPHSAKAWAEFKSEGKTRLL